MSTQAQLTANRENAQHSTGAVTPEGKAIVSQNRISHGLAGNFRLLGCEDTEQYQTLIQSLYTEHQPASDTESRLVESAAQHFWLMQRAITLQDDLFLKPELDHKAFGLFIRYQTTNERAYYRALNELRTIRKEKRRDEIGFESQKRREASEALKESRRLEREARAAADQTRKQEAHEARVRLIHARASSSELDTDIRGTIDAPLPGHTSVPFNELSDIFRFVLRNLNKEFACELANKEFACELANKEFACELANKDFATQTAA